MSFAKRLKSAREKAGKTQQDIADVFGLKREAVAQWESDSGGNYPTADKLPRLASAVKSSVDYLLTGKQRAVDSPESGYTVASGPELHRLIPLISWVRAGSFEEAVDNLHPGEAEEWYPIPRKAGPRTYALRVQGDSMTSPYGRSYPAGSVIFVDPDLRSPANGKRVIAKLEGTSEVTFKVFVQEGGRAFLRPLNQQYPPIMNAFKVIGTVIGKWEDD